MSTLEKIEAIIDKIPCPVCLNFRFSANLSCDLANAPCSVDSRVNSKHPEDRGVFKSIVSQLAQLDEIEVIGISGGEPFAEKWALTYAVQMMAYRKKSVIVFTSGVWATKKDIYWIADLLTSISTVYLSTDSFHREQIDDAVLAVAVQYVQSSGAWLVFQIIDEPGSVDWAEVFLSMVLGPHWRQFAEINIIPLLPFGKAENFVDVGENNMDNYGRCHLLCSPVIRYDGRVTACCNEHVITGKGPANLSRFALGDGSGVDNALNELAEDTLNEALQILGIKQTLNLVQSLSDLKEESATGICDACWKIQNRVSQDQISASDRMRLRLATQAVKNHHEFS